MKRKKFEWTGRLILIIFSLILVLSLIFFITKQTHKNTTEQLLTEYMNYINKHEYEKMYKMISKEHSSNISMEEFVKRNKNIYEGLETKDLSIKILNEKSNGKEISYLTSFNTLAGEVKFQNEVNFIKEKFEYKLVWKDSIIFPQLESTDKVRIDTVEAERGQILDRNGKVLAGKGVASSVGLVPGKIQDKENTIIKLAELLEVDIDVIKNKLSAEWVKDDSFVPIKTIPKVSELELMKINPDENLVKLKENQEELLSIPGVMINDIEVRDYPLKEAASHLVGYIQKVTAEDLEENKGKGYDSNSVIGRSGIESLYEDKLKGQNGCMIYIEDEFGNRKDIIVDKPVQNGEDIQLTIDAELQKVLYEQFKDDKSCSVAMNQYTGEVLALVSTPSFNSNDFVMGMSDKLWKSLNEDERQPLYNRFRQVWCPGSTFKPVTAVIGLDTGILDPVEDYGNEGLSWQKDSSWGDYYVTTLHETEPATLENAMIYSDNIYFAKVALKLGENNLTSFLEKLGFNKEIPFDIKMSISQYSNTEGIKSEIQLADSGYGQGQILINPLHLASIYSAFSNDGNIIEPTLLYNPNYNPNIWMPEVIQKESIHTVLETTDKGWIIWEKALSRNQEMDMHVFYRILPLDEQCRELGNKCITPVSYFCNNLFLVDWNQNSLENIEFNDLFEFLYTMKYGEKIDEKKYASGIPKVEFEEVVTTYFDISIETLEIYAQYDDVKGVYPWEAIGPWNRIQQFQPFPEVVNCIENEDGSLTLTVEAVFQEEGTDCSFRHEVTIREEGDKWIYLGNCIEREGAYKIPEYKPRRDF